SQIAGWSAYAVVAGTIPALFGSFEPAVALGALLAAAIGLLATHLLRRQILRKAWLALPLRRLAPRLLAAAASIAGVLTATVVLPVLPHLPAGVRAGAVAGDLIAHFTIVLGWSLIYSAAHYLRAVRAAEAEKWRLELAKRDAELGALRAQLNPHFLFNSLNSLRALIAEDPARAQHAVTALAALLRYTLRLSRSHTTPLADELDATRHFLELEAIRFEDRLRYGIDAAPDTLALQVPPMLVQTLVENAVKHGIAQLPAGGSIEVPRTRTAVSCASR